MSNKLKSLWLASLSTLSLALAIPSATAQNQAGAANPVTLRIAYLKGTSDLTLAKAKGTLERELAPLGVKVLWAGPFPAAAPAFEALNAGSVDITSGSSTSFVTAVAGGVPLAVFGYQRLPKNGEGIVVKQNSDIRSVKDLVGKRVAVNRGGTGEYLLVQALTKAGVAPEKVVRSYLLPGESGPAFVQNHVDAWATWDPFLSIAIETYNGRVLADGAEIGSENAVAYFVRQDFLQQHRPIVKAVLDALKQENNWTRTHALEAGKVWAQELGLPPALAQRLGENNISPLSSVSKADVEQIAHIATWYYHTHITPVLADVKAHSVDLDK